MLFEQLHVSFIEKRGSNLISVVQEQFPIFFLFAVLLLCVVCLDYFFYVDLLFIFFNSTLFPNYSFNISNNTKIIFLRSINNLDIRRLSCYSSYNFTSVSHCGQCIFFEYNVILQPVRIDEHNGTIFYLHNNVSKHVPMRVVLLFRLLL